MRALHLTPLLIVLVGPAFGQDASLQRCRAIPDATARVACYDALVDATAPPAVSRTPAAAVIAASPPPNGSFGLPQRSVEAQQIRSAVGPKFAGWGPNSRIRLDNGQVWQVIDGSSVSLPEGPRSVTVTRGLFGAFTLEFEGLKTSPKARRVE